MFKGNERMNELVLIEAHSLLYGLQRRAEENTEERKLKEVLKRNGREKECAEERKWSESE